MMRKGYVEQQLDFLGVLLGHLLKLKAAGDYEAAGVELRAGCKRLTGLEMDTVVGLPETTLLTLLGGGVSVRDFLEVGKCVVLASLLHEQAELFTRHGRADAALAADRRALILLCEAMIHEPSLHQPEYRERADALIAALRPAGALSAPAMQHRLFRYHEAVGAFDRAENALYALREESDDAALRREALAFYDRLLLLSDEVLIAGNLPRAEVEEAKAEMGVAAAGR